MARLVHEIWAEIDENGNQLEGCCLAGPMGDDFRKMQDGSARLLTTFEAGSYFEAMTLYYQYLGRGPYVTDQPWDYEPYPEEWLNIQLKRRRDGDS